MVNRLNDLTNTEWMVATKSVWMTDEPGSRRLASLLLEFGAWLKEEGRGDHEILDLLGQALPSVMPSTSPVRDEHKIQHPATFPEPDIEKLIAFFTKRGETVLDPFVGSGTTCIAAMELGRLSIGVELLAHWVELARRRVDSHDRDAVGDGPGRPPAEPYHDVQPVLVQGDACQVVDGLPAESVQLVVTSPPYWGILSKKADHKTKAERLGKNLPKDYGGNEAADLSNIDSYEVFVDAIAGVLGKCHAALQSGRYACVVVSDFRHGSKFYAYHADLAAAVERHGLTLEGITVLAQNSKNLYPYGIPYAFVSNIHHQYVLVFRKPKAAK